MTSHTQTLAKKNKKKEAKQVKIRHTKINGKIANHINGFANLGEGVGK